MEGWPRREAGSALLSRLLRQEPPHRPLHSTPSVRTGCQSALRAASSWNGSWILSNCPPDSSTPRGGAFAPVPALKGTKPRQARPAGGRAFCRRSDKGPQARQKERHRPAGSPPPERGNPKGENLSPFGLLSPISWKEMGPPPGRREPPRILQSAQKRKEHRPDGLCSFLLADLSIRQRG